MCSKRLSVCLQFTLYVCSVWSTLAFAQNSAMPEVLRIASHELRPYHWENESGNILGPAVTRLTCALSRMMQAHEIRAVPLTQAQKLVESGVYDAFFIASQNTKRDQYATFSNPFYFDQWLFVYHPKRVFTVQSDSAKLLRLGVLRGSNMAHWASENDFKGRFESDDFEQLFNLLALRRLDAVMVTKGIYEQYRSTQPLQSANYNFVSEPVRELNLGMYFGHTFLKRFPGYLAKFNKSVTECVPELS